jgi:hypothetical protein
MIQFDCFQGRNTAKGKESSHRLIITQQTINHLPSEQPSFFHSHRDEFYVDA